MDTRGKRGVLNKSIVVTSNDPRNRKTTIRVRADVQLDFDFESPNLYVGKLEPDEPATRSAFIRVKDPEEIEITSITTSSPLIHARNLGFTAPDKDPNRLEIEVTIEPGFPAGQFQGTVTVHSNLERRPKAEIRVWGQILVGVEVTPQALSFIVRAQAGPGRDKTKSLLIVNHEKSAPLEILEVSDQGDCLDLHLVTKEKGQEFDLTVNVKQREAPDNGQLSGSILIRTDNPQYPTFEIPYDIVWQQ